MKHIFTLMALLIAKITAFGVRRTHMWLSKNKCIHSVSLFGADFGLFWKWVLSNNDCYWCSISRHDNTLLSASVGWYWYRRHVVSTRWCHMPYSPWNNSITAWDISYSSTLSFRGSELAPYILWFNTIRFIFMRGYLKSKVYVNKPTTTRALQEEIKRCINEIQPHLCKMVMENFDKRVCICQESRGGHLSDMPYAIPYITVYCILYTL